MALMADKICGSPCNFKIAFICWDLATLTLTVSLAVVLLLLNEYYLHAVKQKSCKSMLQT